ncbi:MAG: hypothetical protein HUJ71_01940 [Pseudobutyrivibrio sp.]|nr:hypothetical protein [Pseudobutyrivibrio sp.]
MGDKVDATFVIHISATENSSWQGQVTWADTNETVNFRSALELLKMMDKAVSSAKKE